MLTKEYNEALIQDIAGMMNVVAPPKLFMTIPEHFFNTKIRRACEYADIVHTGQMYGDQPYIKHLTDTYKVFLEFVIQPVYGRESIPVLAGVIDKYQDISCAIWLHDAIEDTGTTFDEIEEHFGTDVASFVNAVSGEGKTRKEKLASIGRKIEECPDALIIKLCDRIANTRSSSQDYYSQPVKGLIDCIGTYDSRDVPEVSGLFAMYINEFPAFKNTLGGVYSEIGFIQKMWKYLEGISGF